MALVALVLDTVELKSKLSLYTVPANDISPQQLPDWQNCHTALLLQQKIRINYIVILSFTNLLNSHKH